MTALAPEIKFFVGCIVSAAERNAPFYQLLDAVHAFVYNHADNIAVAQAGTLPWDELAAAYDDLLTEAMAARASRGRHVNTIQHLLGFMREDLSPVTKAKMLEVLGQYRAGIVPMVVPLTLLDHHLETHRPHEWAMSQVYLRPYPEELMLRNFS